MFVDFGAQRGSEPWDLDVDDAEETADYKEVHAPGGSLGEAAAARAGKDTPKSPPPKKTRTVEPPEMAQRAAQPTQAQRLSARAKMNLQDTDFFALAQRARAIIPALAGA